MCTLTIIPAAEPGTSASWIFICLLALHGFPSAFCLSSDDVDAQHFGSWNAVLLPNVGLLHHFVSLSWLKLVDSSPSVDYTSFLTGVLSPQLEDYLCLASNSSSQSLTPLGLDVPECSEGPVAKAIWRGLLCVFFWWQEADHKGHDLAKYTLTRGVGEGKEITGRVT